MARKQKGTGLIFRRTNKILIIFLLLASLGALGSCSPVEDAKPEVRFLPCEPTPEPVMACLQEKARAGNPRAMYAVYNAYDCSDDKTERYKWLLKAANLGYIPARYIVARGNLWDDSQCAQKAAVKELTVLAGEGYYYAANELGESYEYGWHAAISKDPQLADYWNNKASSLRDSKRYADADAVRTSCEKQPIPQSNKSVPIVMAELLTKRGPLHRCLTTASFAPSENRWIPGKRKPGNKKFETCGEE